MTRKIAQVITLSEMGGAQKHVLLLSSQLKEKGYDITIFAAPGGDLVENLREKNIRFTPLPQMVREINPIKDLKTLILLYRIFKRERFDVVHCHSSKAGLLGRIAARLAGINKIVYTVHGFVFNEPMGSLKKNIYIAIEKIGAMFGTDSIAVSQKDLDTAIDYKIGNKNKIGYIPNAIENVSEENLRSKADIRESLEIKSDDFVIGTVANFYDTKGHIYLVEAVKRLYDEGFNFKTVFAGEGPRMEFIKEKCVGYDNFIFLGYRKDNLDVINSFDLFVLPSVKEGMPYVILEAMSISKPVLCTRVGAMTNMISNKENGIIVNPGVPEELYREIKWALNSREEISRIGAFGKSFVNEKYSLDAFINEVIGVYDN